MPRFVEQLPAEHRAAHERAMAARAARLAGPPRPPKVQRTAVAPTGTAAVWTPAMPAFRCDKCGGRHETRACPIPPGADPATCWQLDTRTGERAGCTCAPPSFNVPDDPRDVAGYDPTLSRRGKPRARMVGPGEYRPW